MLRKGGGIKQEVEVVEIGFEHLDHVGIRAGKIILVVLGFVHQLTAQSPGAAVKHCGVSRRHYYFLDLRSLWDPVGFFG